jgi:ABC-type nitrate/sulfonate/bicarbonate transport system substrate-binding protein
MTLDTTTDGPRDGGLSRRGFHRRLATSAAAGLLAMPGCGSPPEQATTGRGLDVFTVGFTLGVHTPAIAAWSELLGSIPGYRDARLTRFDRLPVITQSILSGSGDLGDGDILTTLRAIQAGADLKIIGMAYHSTSLVIVADKSRVKSIHDLAAPGTIVAVNSKGDFTHVMMVKSLADEKIDVARLNLLEIGGSGDRMRALQAGRVHAVPVHLDQAAGLVQQEKFHVILEPWQVFPVFPCEVIFCRGAWLAKPANERAAVDFLKTTIRGFRQANADLEWYAGRYRTYVTQPGREQATADSLRPLWETLRDKVRAWPDRMESFSVEAVRELVPSYLQAGAIRGELDVARAVETSCLEAARQELEQA